MVIDLSAYRAAREARQPAKARPILLLAAIAAFVAFALVREIEGIDIPT